MPAVLFSLLISLFILAAAPAQAAICTVMGPPDAKEPIYGKPAGPQTGVVKGGTVMTTMGGGHDPSGRTWLLVGRGATRGWIDRTKLICK